MLSKLGSVFGFWVILFRILVKYRQDAYDGRRCLIRPTYKSNHYINSSWSPCSFFLPQLLNDDVSLNQSASSHALVYQVAQKYLTGQSAIYRQPCEIVTPKFLTRRDPNTIINVKKLNSLKQCLTATRPTSHNQNSKKSKRCYYFCSTSP